MRILGAIPRLTPLRKPSLLSQSLARSLPGQPPCIVLLLVVLTILLVTAGCTDSAGYGNGTGSPPMAGTTTPMQGPVVTADAYPPADPYEIDPRFVGNSPQYRVDPALFSDVYHGRFILNYSSAGLLATVAEAPLVIDFSVTPGNRDPVYSFFILTVRDAGTGQVVGQEGFGRTFSIESPKRLVFTSPGRYHLNLYGSLVDVDLRIRMKNR